MRVYVGLCAITTVVTFAALSATRISASAPSSLLSSASRLNKNHQPKVAIQQATARRHRELADLDGTIADARLCPQFMVIL